MKNMTANTLLARTEKELLRGGWKRSVMTEGGKGTDVLTALIRAKYRYTQGKKFQDATTFTDSRFRNAIVKGAARKISKVLGMDTSYLDPVTMVGIWNESTTDRRSIIRTLQKARK